MPDEKALPLSDHNGREVDPVCDKYRGLWTDGAISGLRRTNGVDVGCMSLLKYEACVRAKEARIAELEMRLAEERTAHRRVMGHRDRQAVALADAQLLLGAYASDASWRHEKSWAGDQPGYEPARDCLARIAEKMSSFTLAADLAKLREAAKDLLDHVVETGCDDADCGVVCELRDVLKEGS